MRAHLQRKGIDARDVERSIQALVEQGYLDDARFARLFVQDKRELEEWGADRIRQVLRTRGVDSEMVEEALAEHEPDSEGEIERALAVLRRRFPSPAGDRRERERALGVLLRKGYDVRPRARGDRRPRARHGCLLTTASLIHGAFRDGRDADRAPVRPSGSRGSRSAD